LNKIKAFEDMSKLMEQAKEMVILSKNITERLRQKKGEITDDEVANTITM
jgi:ESCRT-II complex subunit VPS36